MSHQYVRLGHQSLEQF